MELLVQHMLEKCFLLVSKVKSIMFEQDLHVQMIGQELRTNQIGHCVGFLPSSCSYFFHQT